ncbi:MAG: hypothetical protein VSS52_013275 [Thiotrichaceae bacterium]|nr:hypothetical protein [Thiotrichaceae bacterium]
MLKSVFSKFKIEILPMKLKLLNHSSTNEPYRETPSLVGLDTSNPTETAKWAKEIIKADFWQSNNIELKNLKALVDNIPIDIFENEVCFVSWDFNDTTVDIELSLVLSQLANSLYLIEEEKLNQSSLILE